MDTYNIHFVKLDIEVSDLSTSVFGNVTILAKATQELDTLLFDFKDLSSGDTYPSLIKNPPKPPSR